MAAEHERLTSSCQGQKRGAARLDASSQAGQRELLMVVRTDAIGVALVPHQGQTFGYEGADAVKYDSTSIRVEAAPVGDVATESHHGDGLAVSQWTSGVDVR